MADKKTQEIDEVLASDYYDQITELIVDFEKDLNEDQEIGVRLVNFGEDITFTLTDIFYKDPALICFIGQTEDEEEVQLIQHVNQISVFLMKQQIVAEIAETPREPIGFKLQRKKQRA